MKHIQKILAALVLSSLIAGTAFAGECCTKAVDKAKKGEACAACVKGKCCKEAIKKAGEEAKPCKACEKK